MVLKDIINDYKYINFNLFSCEEYFKKCEDVIDCYYNEISLATAKYFCSAASDTTRSAYTSEISSAMSKCFTLITKLNSASLSLFSCLGKLSSHNYTSSYLKLEMQHFTKSAEETIVSVNKIIEAQLDGMKKNNLLVPFIKSAHILFQNYYKIKGSNNLLINLDQELLEPLPQGINEDEITEFEIRSFKVGYSFSEYIDDLSNLSSFINQYELIMQNQNKSNRIYFRKLETGSLRIVFGSLNFELNCISDIVKAISESIRNFRLTKVEKQRIAEEIRSLKIKNDERELAIINSQISIISETLELSTDIPENIETLQRLCLPIVKYINNNPVGQVGNYKYDVTSEVKRLEDFYFRDDDAN